MHRGKQECESERASQLANRPHTLSPSSLKQQQLLQRESLQVQDRTLIVGQTTVIS